MALDQSVLLEVLDVRVAAETVHRALIEAELTDPIGGPARAFR